MKKTIFIWFSFCLFAWRGQAQNIEGVKKEITQLRQLPTSINNVLNSIKITNFGPFEISGKCGYDWHWYCFGDCYNWTWSWKFPNFTWLKGSLESQYKNVLNTSTSFDAYFNPVKNWLLVTLPKFADNYKTEMDKLVAAQAVFKNASSNPSQKEAAKQAVISSIEHINTGLNTGSNEIKTGISNLGNFSSRMTAALNGIENLRQTMESSITTNHQQVINKTATFPCDMETVRNKATEFENIVRSQFLNVTTQAQKFRVVSKSVDFGTSLILGTLVSIQNQYQGTLQRLKNAQISPEGAIQELRLNVTYQSWTELVSFAKKEFQ